MLTVICGGEHCGGAAFLLYGLVVDLHALYALVLKLDLAHSGVCSHFNLSGVLVHALTGVLVLALSGVLVLALSGVLALALSGVSIHSLLLLALSGVWVVGLVGFTACLF